MTPHWEASAPGVRGVYQSLSGILRGSDFYLAGGTALALMEAHRISGDIDLLAPELDDPEALAREFEKSGESVAHLSTAPGTLTLEMSGVPVSLMAYGYPQLQTTVQPESGLLPLAAREDIAAMKLSAVASRGSRKDFIDLWVLVTRGKPLAEYLDAYGKKFMTRDIGHVVRSLVFFDDADETPPLKLLIDLDWEELKDDFRKWVGALL